MKRTPKVLLGTAAGILQTLIAIGLQVVLMPLILRIAGQEILGVYVILLQIIGYLALIDLGIFTALGRSLSQATDDPARFRALLSSGFYFLGLMGGAYALLGTALALALGDLFHLSGPVEAQARVAMVLLAGWGLLRFPLNIYNTALLAIQDLSIPPLIGALTNVIRMVLSVIAVQAGLGVIGLVSANILAEMLLAGCTFLRFKRLRPGWAMQMRRFHPALVKEMLRFGFQAFWGNLAGRVILFTDNLVVGNLYGAAITSVYYNTQTPISIPYNLAWRLADNASPGINQLWAVGERQKLGDIFLRLQRLTLLMVALVVVGGWFYLEPTISIWVGPSQFGGQWMTLWLILFAGLVTAGHVSLVFVYASGDIRRFSQIVTLEAAVNLGLSFVLGVHLGPHGVALATTVAHIPTAVYLQNKVQRDLNIAWQDWLRQTVWPALSASTVTAITAGVMVSLARPDSWSALVLHGTIIAFVHVLSSFGLGLTAADHAAVRKMIGERFPRPKLESRL